MRVQGPLYTLLLVPRDIPSQKDERYNVFFCDKTTDREILREISVLISLDVDINNTVNSSEKYYCLLQNSSGVDLEFVDPDDDNNYYLIALLLKYNGTNKNYSRHGRI